MSLLKNLGRAFNSTDLSHSPLEETDTDRLGAVAFAGNLGGELLRLQLEGSYAPKHAAFLLVRTARKISSKVPITTSCSVRLAAVALSEFLRPSWSTCKGRGYTISKVWLERTCVKCSGTGTRRYTDVERGAGMGMKKALAPGHSRTIDLLVGECGRA